jgi:hypothetical protein
MIHFLGSLTASSRTECTRPVTDTPDRLIRVDIPLNWAARQRLASVGWVVSNVCISGSLRAHYPIGIEKAGGRDTADLSMRLPAQGSGAVAASDNRGRVCLIKDYHLPRWWWATPAMGSDVHPRGEATRAHGQRLFPDSLRPACNSFQRTAAAPACGSRSGERGRGTDLLTKSPLPEGDFCAHGICTSFAH